MMSLLLSISLVWFLVAVLLLLICQGGTLHSLWREPVLAQPVLIVESDDWGPGPPADGVILGRIAARLADIRDVCGHPAVMTLGLVAGHPDGPAILASGLARYYRRTLDEAEFAPIVEAIRAGCAAGVFSLQRHGLEHCWPGSLLARARQGDALRRWLADSAARSETLPPPLQSRWVDSRTLPSRPLPEAEVQTAVAEEAALLEHIFGSAPTVAVPNTFVWNDAVERAWSATGVTCIVTPGRRLEGRDGMGGLQGATRSVRNGEYTTSGAIQVVRDDYFEPIRGHRAERVSKAVAKKTLLGRPTLLETHRESFILAPESTDPALDELEQALRGARQRYPAVRFMSTADLARHLADPASPLLVHGLMERMAPFLHRVLNEPGPRRLLKFSGLGGALALAAHLMRRVTHGQPLPAAR